MAYIPRSSFIPKEASGVLPARVKRKRSIHVFGLIATLALVGSIGSSVGLFLYNDYLEKGLQSAKDALVAISKVGDKDKIVEIRSYDRKLTVAHNLLENHLTPSRLFEEIENSTKETVRFKTLNFSYDPGFEATLELGGGTAAFSSVVLQKREFSDNGLFSSFLVQNITASNQKETTSKAPETILPDEKVSFDITGTLNTDLLRYEADIPEETNTEDIPVLPEENQGTDAPPTDSEGAVDTSSESFDI